MVNCGEGNLVARLLDVVYTSRETPRKRLLEQLTGPHYFQVEIFG